MPTMTTLSSSREFSRQSSLKGPGVIVLTLSSTGIARGSNKPGAVSVAHAGSVPAPPELAQIDSWLQVNSNNTVTLFHGWTEMGRGSPTAMLQIAAEELGLSIANAFFDATGVRLYRPPMAPAYVRSALRTDA